MSGQGTSWATTTNPPPNSPIQGGEDFLPVPSAPPNVSVFAPDVGGFGETVLTSQPFLVTSAQAQLYFRHAFRLANTDDGGVLEMAIGGQPFADVIRLGGVFTQAGYNVVLGGRNPLGTRPGWSGDSGGWLPTYLVLPPSAAGQPIQLRWRLGTSLGLSNGGWFLDSVVVTDPICPPPVSNPVIVNARLQGQLFAFSINTVSNRTYIIQFKTNLTDSVWQTLQTFIGTGTLQDISTPFPWLEPGEHRFFRFVVQ